MHIPARREGERERIARSRAPSDLPVAPGKGCKPPVSVPEIHQPAGTRLHLPPARFPGAWRAATPETLGTDASAGTRPRSAGACWRFCKTDCEGLVRWGHRGSREQHAGAGRGGHLGRPPPPHSPSPPPPSCSPEEAQPDHSGKLSVFQQARFAFLHLVQDFGETWEDRRVLLAKKILPSSETSPVASFGMRDPPLSLYFSFPEFPKPTSSAHPPTRGNSPAMHGLKD